MNFKKIFNNLINKPSCPYIILTFFLLLIIISGYLFYLVSISRQRITQLEQRIVELEQELYFYKALPTPNIPTEEIFQSGQVGEIEVDPTIPQPGEELRDIIFNTGGIIQEVHRDRVIIIGNGSNFEDRQPRQITLLWTLETDLFLADGTRYVGLRGLEQLSQGMHIGITANENIRGRTEFTARNINIREF